MKYLFYTTKGPRSSNEDSYCIETSNNMLISCVADGVGGNAGGKIASNFATEEFINYSKENNDLKDFLPLVHSKLLQLQTEGKDFPPKATTTFSGIYIKEDKLLGCHTGDTRIYILRNNGLVQLTKDMTEANYYVEQGLMTKQEALIYPRKHILTSVIGMDSLSFENQFFEFELKKNDRLLLLSDGAYNNISKLQIRNISKRYEEISEFTYELISQIKSTELKDNCTMISIQI